MAYNSILYIFVTDVTFRKIRPFSRQLTLAEPPLIYIESG